MSASSPKAVRTASIAVETATSRSQSPQLRVDSPYRCRITSPYAASGRVITRPITEQRRNAEQDLPHPAATERGGDGAHQPSAERGEPQDSGDEQAQGQRDQPGRPQGGGEGLRAVHLLRGEAAGGIDRRAATGGRGQDLPRRAGDDHHDESEAQDHRDDERGAGTCSSRVVHRVDPMRGNRAPTDDEGR